MSYLIRHIIHEFKWNVSQDRSDFFDMTDKSCELKIIWLVFEFFRDYSDFILKLKVNPYG